VGRSEVGGRRSVAGVACLVLVAVSCGEAGPPTPPSFVPNVSFTLEGTFTGSCEVESAQSCPEAPFGTGVAPGTPVSLRVEFDSTTAPTVIADQIDLAVVRYRGIAAELTVDGVALPAASRTYTYIEIVSTPDLYTIHVTMDRGFPESVAGLSIDFAVASLTITPSRHPNVSLPTNPAVFTAAIAEEPFGLALKHHDDPTFASFGLLAPGALLTGEITRVR